MSLQVSVPGKKLDTIQIGLDELSQRAVFKILFLVLLSVVS